MGRALPRALNRATLRVAHGDLCYPLLGNYKLAIIMAESPEELSWLEYFSGGVPTGEYFRMTLDDLRKLVAPSSDEFPRNLIEVCYIGLVSYFEAFCKDHFAAIINILPTTAIRLRDKGHDTTVDVAVLLRTKADLTSQLGFLLAEKFDFGTPQKVNALYGALLTVTPFSKYAASVYDRILRDRHLLVHHGGTFTSSYLQQMRSSGLDPGPSRVFFDSLVVTKEAFLRDVHFFEDIARKLLSSTRTAMNRFIAEEGLNVGKERQKAIDAFLWWGNGDG